MQTQGQRLRKVRQALNLSQQQLGQMLSVSKQYVSNIESDRNILNNEKLLLLLVDLDVNINYILAGIGEPFASQPQALLKPQSPLGSHGQPSDEFREYVREILKEEGLIASA